ncbi:hypothetical protein T4B_6765 [Trichinella pseudospiralis]|uniref:Uncharacterized protein n=1 Tax=Trichinella pseudospiralis TaxID=6337 RepID=A0A0V1GBG2_TRIPS|nr:hypothetical protein T4B_6765 [Trichinella pseudospiralis]
MTEEQCVLDSMAESGSLPRSLVYYMKKRTFLIRLKAGNQLTYLLKILYACFLCLLLALIAVNLITLDSITTFVVC